MATPIAPVFVSARSNGNVVASGTGSVTIGEVAAGDLMLLRIVASRIALPGGSIAIDQPGWTLVAGEVSVTAGADAIYQKIVTDEAEDDVVTFVLGGNTTTAIYAASLLAYRYPADTPVEVTARSLSNDGVAPSVTVSNVPGRLVRFWSKSVQASNTVSGFEAVGGMTTRADYVEPTAGSPGNNKHNVLVADELVSSAGAAGTRTAVNELPPAGGGDLWQPRISVFLAEGLGPDPEPPARAVQSPLDRYRSSISADAGSLLATTRAVPFDTSHSIAFSPAAELDQETLYPFHEATSIQSGTPDVLFYPRARQSLSGPVEYDGVTLLTLMERAYPAQILTTTSDAGLTAVARAQPIIDYVFQQWAAEYSWFTYKPVPDLRLRDVNVTSDWDEPNNAARTVLRDTAIRVLQSPDSPRSMRAMLEDLLSPFPGTQFFMDADGDLVIRPVYGPDADATPHKTLDDADVVTISIGEPSVDQIINRSTVSFRQFTQADDVSVLEPAFLQVASNYMRDASFSPGPPVTDYLVTPPTDRLNLSTADAGFGGWRTIPLGEGVLMGNGPIAFEDSGVLITAAVNTYNSAGVLQEAWTSPGDLTVEVHNTVPLDGSTVLAFTVWRSVGDTTNSYYGRWNARWNTAENALQIQWAGGGLEVNTFSSGTLRAAQMSITINGVARAWAEGASVSATFGVVADGDFIPGPDGSNALQDSVTAFGVLEERFEIRGYGALTPEMLSRIAEARVMTNLTPRATRELALTWKGAVGLEFDDRGRLVGFPGDGEGFLTGRQYADDFLANAGGVTVSIEETVPGSPGSIDDCTEYLLNDDGSLWTNDDLTPSIVAECGEELLV